MGTFAIEYIALAESLIRQAAADYTYRPHLRADVDSWLAGSGAAWTFEETCAVLGIEDVTAAAQWVRTQPLRRQGRKRRLNVRNNQGYIMARETMLSEVAMRAFLVAFRNDVQAGGLRTPRSLLRRRRSARCGRY